DIGGAVQAVLLNPPYLLEGAYTRSDSPARASANSEGDTPLADWIVAARRLSAPKASITLTHRADRLSDLLAELSPAYGDVRIIPLWPRKGVAAKRIIITGQLGSRAPLSLTAGVVVHQSDGSFTPEAQMVLRDGGPLTV
ncbi:MAG: methyltransferase, partial [Pseudomonadota bacterium]